MSSSVSRRVRRMSPKTKARALRELALFRPITCACGRAHTTGMSKCPACMNLFNGPVRL